MKASVKSLEMHISNANLTTTLRVIIGALFLITITDLILALLPGTMNQYFFGYSIFVFPALIIGAYTYVGLPLFSFDAESEVLRFKSHIVFNRFVGKEICIHRRNIVSMTIDRSGIRKKLVIRFLRNGREVEEKFGITFLSNGKIRRLSETLRLIIGEARNISSPHMFI